MKVTFKTLDQENLWISQMCEDGYTDKREAIELRPHQVETIVGWIQESKPEDFATYGEQVKTVRLISDEMDLEIQINK